MVRSTIWVIGVQAAEGMRDRAEARGGIIADESMLGLRKQIDRAIADKSRHRSPEEAMPVRRRAARGGERAGVGRRGRCVRGGVLSHRAHVPP